MKMSFWSRRGGYVGASGQKWWLMHSGGKSVESNSWSSVVAMLKTSEVTGMENLVKCGGVGGWVCIWRRLCGVRVWMVWWECL